MNILPGRIEKYFVKKVATINKASFINAQEKIIAQIKLQYGSQKSISIKMVSFSGKKHLADQLYSLASFYRNVGTPLEWLIVSDGSYDDRDKNTLNSIPKVRVLLWDEFDNKIDETLLLYGQKIPFGKRLHAYMNQPIDQTTIFTDTDILFFPSFKKELKNLCDKQTNWFLSDHGPDYMESYYWQHINKQLTSYLNAGLFIINKKPDWDIAVDYICKRNDFDGWGYLSEQVAINLMFDQEENSHPLNQENFIFNNRDCFHLSHHFDYNKISIRHFAGKYARIKMWQLSWKRILNL